MLDSSNVLIMGPVGVGKTFLAHALGHAAIRHKYSVHAERTDKLFKRLRAAQLDHTHDEQMRKLHRIDLLILMTWSYTLWMPPTPPTSMN